MDQYDEAVKTAATADTVIRWSRPVTAFGDVLLGISVLAALTGVVVLLIAATRGLSGAVALVGLGLILYAILGVVQASVVIMLSSYVKMKSQEVNYRITHFLSPDDE